MPTLHACRLWLAAWLVQLAAWIHPSEHALPQLAFRPLPPPPTALQRAARAEVSKVAGQPFSSVSKRQIVFRALRDQFPGEGVSDLNLALEEAVRDLPRTPEVQTHG
jgi:hypothetical protein